MVLRKKEIGDRERTASVNSLEKWCKRRKEKAGIDSREKTNAEGEE